MTRVAHAQGVSVEAELGKLAGEEDGLSVPEVEARMTDPEVVAPFTEATGIDALAVTIGNVHGKYAKRPQLDFDRLDRIRDATNLPLVLHGASGLPDEMLQRAMRSGVCKFNVVSQGSRFATPPPHYTHYPTCPPLPRTRPSVRPRTPKYARRLALQPSRRPHEATTFLAPCRRAQAP